MSVTADRLAAIVDEERAAWRKRFGGGMIEFDLAYFDMLKTQRLVHHREKDGIEWDQIQPVGADCLKAGAEALLDAFVARLKVRLEQEAL
jgi:hypothetical protein